MVLLVINLFLPHWPSSCACFTCIMSLWRQPLSPAKIFDAILGPVTRAALELVGVVKFRWAGKTTSSIDRKHPTTLALPSKANSRFLLCKNGFPEGVIIRSGCTAFQCLYTVRGFACELNVNGKPWKKSESCNSWFYGGVVCLRICFQKVISLKRKSSFYKIQTAFVCICVYCHSFCLKFCSLQTRV